MKTGGKRASIVLAAVSAAVLTATATALSPTAIASATQPCTDTTDTATAITLTVDGEAANGHYSLPDSAPQGLVVFSHGYGHSSKSWLHHLRRVAVELDVITVAMDYRGITILTSEKAPGIPDTQGWDVTTGAEDGIAAARYFEDHCELDTIVNYGVSMGGNTSGLIAATDVRRGNGDPLFDYWVDIEGAANVSETYTGARILAPFNAFAAQAQSDIETEMGGTFEQRPATYLEKSVVTRTPDMRRAGLKGVVLVHGVDDGLVTHDQSVQMRAALRAVGIPTQMNTVVLKSDESEAETTLTGYVGTQLDPDYRSPIAGHASEMSTTHIVSVTGFERLAGIFHGRTPTCTQEYVVDGQVGTPPPATVCTGPI